MTQISVSDKIDQQTPPDFKKNPVPDLPKNSSTEFIKNCFYGFGGNPNLLKKKGRNKKIGNKIKIKGRKALLSKTHLTLKGEGQISYV